MGGDRFRKFVEQVAAQRRTDEWDADGDELEAGDFADGFDHLVTDARRLLGAALDEPYDGRHVGVSTR